MQFKHVYPAPDTIHPVQSNYIHAYVDSFENALNGVSYLSDSLNYRRWIDVGSFIDFLLLNEVSMNYQSYGLNTYMYKNVDSIQGKLCIGPPWRFDQAMNSNPPTGWVWETTNPGWPYPFWWSRFFTDSSFRSELACRWLSLRSSVLSNSAFMMCADSLSNLLLQGPSERNFATWPTLNGISYPQHLLNTKVFLFNRLSWMDQALSAYGAVLPSLIIPQDTTVCKGITYTAPYHPEYVYNWTPGPETPEITFTTPGNYVLEVRDSSGCERNFPMQVGISEPDTTFTQLNSDIQYTFTGNNGISSQYLWDFGDQTLWGNGLQGVHVYAVPGIYTVQMTVTDTLGCIGKSAQTLQITQGSIQVGIHPNPFQNDPTVVHNLPLDGTFTFMLYDAAGRKLKEYASPASPFTLETHGMAHGTYWLKCAFEGKTIAQSLIRL
ncbi:MAG: PKD domain-containing protein [Flavobacteriia bacterium]|nr:PKD domain-containing protein [Flavobacteriia bacterium]